MKNKIILILMFVCLTLVGCGKDMDNTPTRQVEIFLNKYQTLNTDVLKDLDNVISEEQFNSTQSENYKEIVKSNYQKLSYKIKNETIDGDNAVVTVEIEVVDYSKINNEAEIYLENNPDEFNDENGEYDHTKFIDYRLDKLKEAKETVKYTLDLDLVKKDNNWQLTELDSIELSKINGTYSY